MYRILSFFLVLFIHNIAVAQPERHELGRRLRLFEQAWEAQKDANIRKEPAVNMNKAVMSFFGLQLGEAGKALDQGLLKLQGVDQRDLRLTNNLRCFWLKADSHWLEHGTKTLKVKVDRFYPLNEPRINEVSYAYTWIPENASHLRMRDLINSRDIQVTDGVSKTVFIPGEIELSLPEKEGDYTLRFAWGALGHGEPQIVANYCTVSISKNRDQRLAQLKETISKWPTPFATADEVSVSLNVRVLERLAKGETLETDYPANQILTECEEAVAAIARNELYYHTGKVGQFWMGVRTTSKNIVPLRIQTVEAKPGKKVPVILALHGAGGSENLFFDGYGNGKVARLAWEKGWFVVAPRNSMSKAGHAETIAELSKVFPEIDTNQVFVVGHSMGAAEAIREANATPGKFAAVAALGGGGSPKPAKDQVEAFKKLPFYVGVGENDFGSAQAETLASNLKKAGANEVTFKRYPGIEHMLIVQEALPEVFQFFEEVQKGKKLNDKEVHASDPKLAHGYLSVNDLGKFRIGRSKSDILSDISWRVGTVNAGLCDGKPVTILDYTLRVDPKDIYKSESFHAIFVNDKFEKFIRWDTGVEDKPAQVGDSGRLTRLLTKPSVSLDELQKTAASAATPRKQVDAGLTMAWLLNLPKQTSSQNATMKDYQRNAALREQFNPARLTIGMTEQEVGRVLKAKPIETGKLEAGTCNIYGSNDSFPIDVDLYFSNVVVLFKDSKAISIFSFPPSGINGQQAPNGGIDYLKREDASAHAGKK